MKHYFLYLIFIACTCAVFFCTCIALFGCSSPVMGDDEQILLSDSGITEQNAASWCIESGSDFDEKKSIIALELGAELISVQKNTPSYVMAYPIAADGHEAGMPYGAIYPFSTKLRAEDGFAASILQELYCTCTKTETLDYNIKHFNWQKFMELCREYENPWLINRNRIITAIKAGKFKKSDIKIDAKKK